MRTRTAALAAVLGLLLAFQCAAQHLGFLMTPPASTEVVSPELAGYVTHPSNKAGCRSSAPSCFVIMYHSTDTSRPTVVARVIVSSAHVVRSVFAYVNAGRAFVHAVVVRGAFSWAVFCLSAVLWLADYELYVFDSLNRRL